MTEPVSLVEVKTRIRSKLHTELFDHSVLVSETSGELCRMHCPEFEVQGRLAGLLHDVAKPLPDEELQELVRKFGIKPEPIEQKYPTLLHAPVGAELARYEFGIDDETVLESIRWHTVGCAGMSACAISVYLADIIEPSRDYPGVERIRASAQVSLMEGALAGVARTIEYVIDRRRPLEVKSIEFYNWLLSVIRINDTLP